MRGCRFGIGGFILGTKESRFMLLWLGTSVCTWSVTRVLVTSQIVCFIVISTFLNTHHSTLLVHSANYAPSLIY